MAATLARMQRDGLLRRKSDPSDARASLLRLSPKAKSKLPGFFKQLEEENELALMGLNDQERRHLKNLLSTVIRNLVDNMPGGG
jgi:MarR family transcriptional regulator for hemolysin